MDQDDGNLARLVRVEHVEPGEPLEPLGLEQADRLEDRQGAAGEVKRQRGGQVRRQRRRAAGGEGDPAVADRVVQLQDRLGAEAGASVARACVTRSTAVTG